ncbi:unnamed protein product [Prorocentrum cordatum]|uniref:Uncharacterized protein n=1 Tax=Prorocentrum cordatum TaxID=2364126 RepID=A0ABN9Q8P6_9DINO|nr:unnamed protein product [Polarella glacialis]
MPLERLAWATVELGGSALATDGAVWQALAPRLVKNAAALPPAALARALEAFGRSGCLGDEGAAAVPWGVIQLTRALVHHAADQTGALFDGLGHVALRDCCRAMRILQPNMLWADGLYRRRSPPRWAPRWPTCPLPRRSRGRSCTPRWGWSTGLTSSSGTGWVPRSAPLLGRAA